MGTIKTLVNDGSVIDFINSNPDEQKRADSLELLKLFKKVTGQDPKLWGTSIIGYDMYHYKSERSKQEGDWPMTGFSPRKQALTIYLMLGTGMDAKLLAKLGKHKTSVGCLYIKRLSEVDMGVLEQIVAKSYGEMRKKYQGK